MNVFDIIGPVMIGPSSSHTAGAVRIGNITRELLGEEPKEAVIKLHGSFAHTYKGHGTDKAIIGGLMGFRPDDLRIRKSMMFALKEGFKYSITTADLGDVHPNTALIEVKGINNKKVEVLASSVGGGNIVVKRINGLEVEFTGQNHTIVIPHKDAAGVVAAVTHVLASYAINIAHMKVYRSYRGGNAIMVIGTDQQSNEVAQKLNELRCVDEVIMIKPL